MNAVPPQHWPNHHTVRIPPAGIQREPVAAPKKLPVQFKAQMERDFKEELLRPRSFDGTMLFNLPDLPPVLIRLNRFGQTALAACVFRQPRLDIECVTLCLSGIDDSEDELALTAAREFLVGGDTRDPVVKGLNDLIELVRREPRPIGAHIHLDERSYDDQGVRVVTGCLSQAFFDLFGSDKIAPRQS